MKFTIFFFGQLAVFVFLLLYFHHLGEKIGYKRGRDEGYNLGRIDADNWWMEIELQAEQARRKIWVHQVAMRAKYQAYEPSEEVKQEIRERRG